MCRIYASVNWVIIASGNGLSPVRRQAITWTNARLLSIRLLGTNFNEIWIGILSISFKKVHFKMSSAETAAILSRVWGWGVGVGGGGGGGCQHCASWYWYSIQQRNNTYRLELMIISRSRLLHFDQWSRYVIFNILTRSYICWFCFQLRV